MYASWVKRKKLSSPMPLNKTCPAHTYMYIHAVDQTVYRLELF